MQCIVCDNEDLRARKVSENDLAWAYPTNIPITPGHTLIVPKRHATRPRELSNEERLAILDLAEEIKSALAKAFGAKGFNVAYNEGSVAGQNVAHFHMHIVPRTEGDAGIVEYEPRKFLYRPGSRATSAEEELREVASLIRAHL